MSLWNEAIEAIVNDAGFKTILYFPNRSAVQETFNKVRGLLTLKVAEKSTLKKPRKGGGGVATFFVAVVVVCFQITSKFKEQNKCIRNNSILYLILFVL